MTISQSLSGHPLSACHYVHPFEGEGYWELNPFDTYMFVRISNRIHEMSSSEHTCEYRSETKDHLSHSIYPIRDVTIEVSRDRVNWEPLPYPVVQK